MPPVGTHSVPKLEISLPEWGKLNLTGYYTSRPSRIRIQWPLNPENPFLEVSNDPLILCGIQGKEWVNMSFLTNILSNITNVLIYQCQNMLLPLKDTKKEGHDGTSRSN